MRLRFRVAFISFIPFITFISPYARTLFIIHTRQHRGGVTLPYADGMLGLLTENRLEAQTLTPVQVNTQTKRGL